ncbi:MAG TPA: phage major capsid protein, partial [Nitrosomonas sp.]|nr:phage major capsid protein [Nitrosomonas sp.]
MEDLMKALEGIEKKLSDFSEKASGEIQSIGKVSTDTQTAIDNLGLKQRELADEILQLKQRGGGFLADAKKDETAGALFVQSDQYKAFAGGQAQKVRLEVKNTVTNAIGNTFSDRRPSVVGGAFRTLTLESLLSSLPTTSNAVDYVRENVFTNAAAETTEGLAKPESSVTTTAVTEAVATVAHWIKISRQLANDNAALAAYINLRMSYGVDLRVENQIIAGNGTA